MNDNFARMARAIGWFGTALLPLSLSAVPADAQSAPYDGVYAGSQTLSEKGPVVNYSQCLKGPFKRRMVVKDSVVTYTFNPTTSGEVTGPVSADGDVSGSAPEPAGGVVLTGKIVGDGFSGEVWSLYCTYAVELKRLPQ
jgi:hypothetical protein